ncbi:MAG: T9SS type A sorting domain-containing protein, partial [Saprospiraceae bacterium]|nr:T9SS type A sorting domain-containing protein [Saprospiraceae bacterium]
SKIVRMWVISLPSDTRDYCDAVLVVQSDGSGCPGTQGSGGDVMTYEGDMAHTTPDRGVKSGDQNGELDVNGDQGANLRESVHSSLPEDRLESFELFQNRPNPFINNTVIGFNLPKDSRVNLSFFDLNGRLIKQLEGTYGNGYHEIEVNIHDFAGSTRILYYQLETPEYSATRRMVILN